MDIVQKRAKHVTDALAEARRGLTLPEDLRLLDLLAADIACHIDVQQKLEDKGECEEDE